MKLKKYVKELQEILKDYPDVYIVYARDDEGNGFQEVYFTPTLGWWDKVDKEFTGLDEDLERTDNVNAVCVN